MAIADAKGRVALRWVFSGQALQLLLVTIIASAGNYAQLTLSPLQEAVRITFPLSDNQIAVIQGPVMALPLVLGSVPLGLLIDRYSRAALLVIFMLCGVVGNVISALSCNFAELVGARLLIGAASAAIPTAAYSLIGDIFLPAYRGKATMVLSIGQLIGPSVAFACGGSLLVSFAPSTQAWRYAMLWMTAPLVLVAIMSLAVSDAGRTGHAVTNRPVRNAASELWRYHRVIAPILIFGAMVGVANGAAWTWATPMFSRRFALAPDRIGNIMAVVLFASGIAGAVVGGFLTDFCQRTGGARRSIVVMSGLTILSAPAGLFAVAPEVISSSALLLMLIAVGSMISTMSIAVCTVAIPSHLLGLCLGIYSAFASVFGVGLAPLMVSMLSEEMGGAAMIGDALSVICVSTSIIAAVALGFGRGGFSKEMSGG